MRFYLNIPVKFNPDPIWNDGTLRFLKRSPQQEEAQKQDDWRHGDQSLV